MRNDERARLDALHARRVSAWQLACAGIFSVCMFAAVAGMVAYLLAVTLSDLAR